MSVESSDDTSAVLTNRLAPGGAGTLADWLAYISTQHSQEIALGLERSRQVAQQMKLLPLAPRNLIVAGTNGKGSTVRFAESLLLAQGCSVGATLSPHMHRYNERVRINGNEATDAALIEAFAAVDKGRGDIPLTYYEYSILAAFWLFRRAGVDVCVLEVGLGGRLDVTNIVDAEVAVVTSIGLDHQNFLGDTLEEIGAEKAAVCRSGSPLLVGSEMPTSVFELAERTGAFVERLGRAFWYQRSTNQQWSVGLAAGDGQTADLNISSTLRPQIALRNATLAVAAVTKLRRAPTNDELQEACTLCRHPGRFERAQWQQRQLILDVAHNPASAKFLAAQLRAAYPVDSGVRLVACAGFLADKDVPSIVSEVAGLFSGWLFVSTSGARGLSADDARKQALAANPGDAAEIIAAAVCCDDVESALVEARAQAGKADIIVAFGSFQLVQLAREQVYPHERGTA